MDRKLALGWMAAFLAAACYFGMTYGDLPDRVATHFDAAGNPNGYQAKDGYLAFFLRFTFLMNGIFAGTYLLVRRLPLRYLNLPGKDYWLATEARASEALGKLRRLVCLLGAFVNLIFLFTTHIVYQANTPNPVLKLPVTGGVVVILTGVVFLVLYALLILRPPPGSPPTAGKDKSP